MDTMTLAATLKEIKDKAPLRLGPDFLAAVERSVEELREFGIVERISKVGEIAPDFQALNFQGDSINLTDLLNQGPVIISFYRGGW